MGPSLNSTTLSSAVTDKIVDIDFRVELTPCLLSEGDATTP